MPRGKHRRRSKSKSRHKKRKSRKSKHLRSPLRSRSRSRSLKRGKKRRSSKHDRRSRHKKRSKSRSKSRSRSKSKKGKRRSKRRHEHKHRHGPEMTTAAMNENLGNIVLVKNRHKSKSPTNEPPEPPLLVEPIAATTGQGQGPPAPTPTTTGTETTTPTPLPPAVPPGKQQHSIEPAPDLPYVPLSQVTVTPLPQTATTTPTIPTTTATTTPATTTDATTTGVTGATGATTATTTPASTTATATPTTSTPATPAVASAVASSRFEKDELTRKEASLEKPPHDRLQKWKTYIEKTLEGGVEAMAAEFRLIRGHIPPMSTRFGFDANMDKNRFEDVVCIDQTRVRPSGGNYIHASWVGITASRKDILTQLPRPETSGDFWQLILDADVQTILLILTHAEFTMFHANQVFPDEQDFLCLNDKQIRVGEFKRVVIDKDWTMHVISVRSGDKRRFVHMHHYSGWTHGKQPVRILDLWQIQSVFRKYPHPQVYMSLSGCGRAGTYAAFEIAHERLHSENFQKLNVSDCVCRARNGRMHSVQRPIQMQTIHAAIMEHMMNNKFAALLTPATVQKYEDFSARFNKCAEQQQDLI